MSNEYLSSADAIEALSGYDDEAPEAPPVEQEAEDENVDAAPEEAALDEDEDETPAPEEVQAEADDEGDDPEDEDNDADDDAEDDDEPEEPALDAPQFLDETEREAFSKLPRDAQQMVLKHDKMLQADYTRKTQAVAEERKAAEALKQNFEGRINKLGTVVTEAEAAAQEWAQVDWEKAASQLTAEEYNKYRAAADKAFKNAQTQRARLDRAEQEQFGAFVEEQQKLIPTIAEQMKVPEFVQPDAADKVWKPLHQYLVQQGFENDDIKYADARMSAIAWKAKQWDDLQAKRAAKPALTPKPDAKSKGKPVRPAARATSSNRAASKQVKDTFRKTGDRNLAMALLQDID